MEMRTYHKIETIYERDVEGTKHLIEGKFRNPTLEFLKDLDFEWTEKIDGTNTRIFWDGYDFTFGGRTDKAQIPAPLMNRLNAIFMNEATKQLFEQTFGTREVELFGEGYGASIQKIGKDYLPDGVDFILFDVLIAGNFQSREAVEECAQMLGIKAVPVVGYGNLTAAVDFVKSHPQSIIGNCFMEGIVVRPRVELCDRCHNRVIAKIKYEDFKYLTQFLFYVIIYL